MSNAHRRAREERGGRPRRFRELIPDALPEAMTPPRAADQGSPRARIERPAGWLRWALKSDKQISSEEGVIRLSEALAEAVRRKGSPGLVWFLFHSDTFDPSPENQTKGARLRHDAGVSNWRRR